MAVESIALNNTTRLMCAAGYNNSDFRDKVVDMFENNAFRAIAPCYGADLLTVYSHCCRARDRKRKFWIFYFIVAICGFLAISIFNILDIPLLGWLLAATAAAVVYWLDAKGKNIILSRELSEAVFSNRECTAEYETANHSQGAEVLVYSGFSPFVTAGIELDSWSFAANIQCGKQSVGTRLTPRAFETSALYQRVTDELAKLDLRNITIEDIVCVNGRDVIKDSRFSQGRFSRPYTHINRDTLIDLMHRSSHVGRHYKRVQVVDWSGELVFTLFLRFCKEQRNLFCEASYFVMTPVDERYRRIDHLPTHDWSWAMGMLLTAPIAGAAHCLVSPFVMWERLSNVFKKDKEHHEREQIEKNQPFDYGAQVYPRGLVASNQYQRYFQKLDKEFYSKVLVRQILDGIIEFLDEHNIDTSDLRDRQNTIENHGVIVSGGDLNAEALAVGKKAKARANRAETARVATGELR